MSTDPGHRAGVEPPRRLGGALHAPHGDAGEPPRAGAAAVPGEEPPRAGADAGPREAPPADPRLARLAALIADSPHNLVSRGDRAILETVHLPEAVAVAALLPARPGHRWMDLGTGGGLPGLVLALRFPEVEWVLLDSTRKKVDAVRGFAADLGLDNVTALAERAEDAARKAALRGSFDGVVARAVAPLRVLAELARGFPRPGGLLIAIKGPAWSDEVEEAAQALRLLRWSLSTGVPVPSAVRPTWLVTLHADGPPPGRYPRRAGVPKREPLGDSRSGRS